MKEIWKDIKGYEGIYQVSNMGNVRSLDRVKIYSNGAKRLYKGKIMKPAKRSGYMRITLSKINSRVDAKTYSIHRLVLENFIRPPKKDEQCNHIDGNKSNNVLSNLEWVSQSENIRHAMDTGLFIHLKGSKHGMSKLNESDVVKIKEMLKNGIKRKDIASKFNVSLSLIGQIAIRDIWKHVK